MKLKEISGIFLLLAALLACGGPFQIIDKPISFSEERIALTKEYINGHYNFLPSTIEILPRIIVLHWTAVDDFDSCFAIFDRETIGDYRSMVKAAGDVNVSVQFLVSREGKVHRLMPETWMGRHCIGINYYSIGVENVGGGGSIDNLTDEQISANIDLIKYLVKKYPSIQYLVGHYEYREFEGHSLWLELDDEYRTEKIDPGERFMREVREGVEELNLKGVKDIRKEKEFSHK